MSVVKYLETAKGVDPKRILLMGNSLGGSVATFVRSIVAPDGPLVAVRTFHDYGAASHHFARHMLKLPLPRWVVTSLVGSFFPGRMNTAALWASSKLTGKRIVLWHKKDEVLPPVVNLAEKLRSNNQKGPQVELEVLTGLRRKKDPEGEETDEEDAHHDETGTESDVSDVGGDWEGINGESMDKFPLPTRSTRQEHWAANSKVAQLIDKGLAAFREKRIVDLELTDVRVHRPATLKGEGAYFHNEELSVFAEWPVLAQLCRHMLHDAE